MKLAINGGPKQRKAGKFPGYNTIGVEEEKAVVEVLRTGVLSKFLGCWDPDFLGGEQIQKFEKTCEEYFQVKHAITVNSNSSGIICALGALGIGAGDEIIVSPYSMSVSACAPLFYGATPVFADIETDTFCLDPKSVEAAITPRTKAIIAVDIFGHPYNATAINAIAKKHNLKVIEDCAQAPLASFNGKFCGTLGNIGVFSLNYHKHIHSGEGGIIVTNDDDLATRCRLIRNHAEAVVEGMNYQGNPRNLVGYNFRMTEIEAAIGICQLQKLQPLVKERLDNVRYLEEKLQVIPFLTMPKVASGASHVYYVHGIKFSPSKSGTTRTKFVEALKAELDVSVGRETDGVLLNGGYVRPLYKQSLYQNKNGFGETNFPFNQTHVQNYRELKLPNVERMHYEEFFSHELMRPGMKKGDLDDVVNAFYKVAENIHELK